LRLGKKVPKEKWKGVPSRRNANCSLNKRDSLPSRKQTRRGRCRRREKSARMLRRKVQRWGGRAYSLVSTTRIFGHKTERDEGRRLMAPKKHWSAEKKARVDAGRKSLVLGGAIDY